jgi:HEAT repeat protein
MLPDLNRKDVDLDALARQALDDRDALRGLVRGLSDRRERVGYNCLRALLLLGDEHPELLYPYWDVFVELLGSENTYFELRAINLVAMTVGADEDDRFEEIFDRYYDLLDDKSVIAASYVAANSGGIARAKPDLQSKITDRLLSLDQTHHPPDRKDLIKGHAVEAFGQFFQESADQPRILEFVRAQLESSSPRTRKKAKEFLKKWADRA